MVYAILISDARISPPRTLPSVANGAAFDPPFASKKRRRVLN